MMPSAVRLEALEELRASVTLFSSPGGSMLIYTLCSKVVVFQIWIEITRGKIYRVLLTQGLLSEFSARSVYGRSTGCLFSRLETLSAKCASLTGSVPLLQISAALVSYCGPPIFCLGWQ